MIQYCFSCMQQLSSVTEICPHCGKKTRAEASSHQLPAGALLKNKYIVGSAIGEGGFGITYIGIDSVLDIRVAIKEFFPVGYINRNNTYQTMWLK